jgi:phosphohistidine phosphatase
VISDHGGARRLLLLRHAKSQWPDNTPDPERPLAERGIADATAAASVLAGIADLSDPDQVLCSPALRTRQTWRLASAALTDAPAVRYEPTIYGAAVSDLVELLHTVPDRTPTVLVIGHEPTMSTTADWLAAPGSQPAGLAQLRTKYPTCGLAVLELSTGWAELGAETAVLQDFLVPRG